MRTTTKYWIEFLSPGSFTADYHSRDCGPNQHPEDVKWPEYAYAFCLKKRKDVVDGDECFIGKVEQISPLYYHPDSVIEQLASVRNNPNATPTLISNMELNGWDRIIWTRWGNWPQPYDPERIRVL